MFLHFLEVHYKNFQVLIDLQLTANNERIIYV